MAHALRRAALLALATVLAWPVAGMAQEWTVGGRVSQRVAFDDNLDLEPEGANEAVSAETRARVDLGYVTPRAEWRLSPGVIARAVVGPATDDEEESLSGLRPTLDGDLAYRGRRFRIGGNFSFLRDSTAFTDFDQEFVLDNGVFIPGETLRRERETTETRLALGADWSLDLDPRNSVFLAANASLRRFADDVADLEPTTSYGGSLGWTRLLSQRTSAGITLGIDRFSADDETDTAADTLSVRASLQHAATPRLDLSGAAGLSMTRREETLPAALGGGIDRETTLGFTGGFGVDYRRSRTSVSFDAEQAVRPSAEGELRNVTSLRFGLAHALTRRTSLRFAANHVLSTSLGSQDEGDDERGLEQFLRLGPSLAYDLAEDWTAEIGYNFRLSDDDDGLATGNQVYLQVSHNFAVLP